MNPRVHPFWHAETFTWTYVVRDPDSPAAAIIDPVLDFDLSAARTSTASVDQVVAHCRANELEVRWIVETHAHADHLSAAARLKAVFDAPVAAGDGIQSIQEHFGKLFNLPSDFRTDGSQFDRLLFDGDVLPIGGLEARVIATPGHTRDSISLLIGDAVFVGDLLFAPDFGAGRCDFPGGDAGQLYDSIQKLYALPDETRMFLCHDYPPDGRDPRPEFSVGEQKTGNLHVREGTGRDEFIVMRTARDKQLAVPRLIIPAVQFNINGGAPLPPEANGISYFRMPVDLFPGKPAA